MGQEVLLQMTDICKEFPGVKALDHVSLTVKKGTVHALMGENGAGKSTLMKCLFGIYSKDAGKIELSGCQERCFIVTGIGCCHRSSSCQILCRCRVVVPDSCSIITGAGICFGGSTAVYTPGL